MLAIRPGGAILGFTTAAPSTTATKLVVTTEPASTTTAGSPFSVTIAAEDDSGTVDATYAGIVSLAISTGPAAGTLSGTTMLALVDGMATFSGLGLSSAGTYTIAATSEPLSPATTTQIVVTAVKTASMVDGPKIVSLLRYGYHMMPTTLVLSFDEALEAVTAQDAKVYHIIGPAGRVIGIKSAVYDPATLTVTLHPKQRINIHHAYELIVDGTAPAGPELTSRASCSMAPPTASPAATTARL